MIRGLESDKIGPVSQRPARVDGGHVEEADAGVPAEGRDEFAVVDVAPAEVHEWPHVDQLVAQEVLDNLIARRDHVALEVEEARVGVVDGTLVEQSALEPVTSSKGSFLESFRKKDAESFGVFFSFFCRRSREEEECGGEGGG